MRIVFLGAPGSGKGTQATRIKERLGIAHVSTGELLRAAVAAGTPIGLRVRAVMEAGQLVSDELMLSMLEERLSQSDAVRGFILDGYPRNLAQGAALDGLLERIGQPLDGALYLEVPEELLFQRLAGRAAEEGRKDDHPETVRQRLAVYQQQTAPLIDFYSERGLLNRIDGVGELDDISDRLLAVIAAND